MNRDYSICRNKMSPGSVSDKHTKAHPAAAFDALVLQRERQQAIRGIASTLECMVGAVGGYSYSVLLGLRPGLSNTDALKAFVEQQMGEGDGVPDVLTLVKQVRCALDRALQARDEI